VPETLELAPGEVREAIASLRADWDMLLSVHGCDYLPAEPRLGVHYELISMTRLERLHVKTRLTIEQAEAGELHSVVDIYPSANAHEREVFDFFGVRFTGHPDLKRILMPDDYVGYPQRRDFPVGGEPVLFTFNEHETPRWYE